MIFRPDYVNRIMTYTDTTFVKILTGVRRCGKSTILLMLMEELRKRGVSDEQIVNYRFDSMEYADMTAKQMYAEIKGRLADGKRSYTIVGENKLMKIELKASKK